jgi:hypothetical protein
VQSAGLHPAGLIDSPILGPKGNHEYLLWSRCQGEPLEPERLLAQIFPHAG